MTVERLLVELAARIEQLEIDPFVVDQLLATLPPLEDYTPTEPGVVVVDRDALTTPCLELAITAELDWRHASGGPLGVRMGLAIGV